MNKDNQLRQYLELTNTGYLRYSIIKFNLVSEKDTILFTTEKRVSDVITKDSELTKSSQNEIGLFIVKVANFAHSLKKSARYADQLDKMTVILPSEITTLKSQVIDASYLTILNNNTLKNCLEQYTLDFPQMMRIIVEDRSVTVDGKNYRFSDPNIPTSFNKATILSLNAYAKQSYVAFLKNEINREFNISPIFISKGNVLKKDLIISQSTSIVNVNQPKIIFDWGLTSTSIETDAPKDKERFQIPFGIMNMVERACVTLGINSKLNRELVLNTYFNTVNFAGYSKSSTWLRTTNENNEIVEISNTELMRVLSDAISSVINDAVIHLISKNHIDVANDAQKFHTGLLSKVNNLKETYKAIDYTHGLNNYIVESDYETKFEGVYSDKFYSSFVLAKNEKARIKSDLNKAERLRTDAIIFADPVDQQERASLMKQKQFVKKYKVSKNK